MGYCSRTSHGCHILGNPISAGVHNKISKSVLRTPSSMSVHRLLIRRYQLLSGSSITFPGLLPGSSKDIFSAN